MDNKTNINWYPGHMAKTKRLIKENIDLIDVVYEVIDARMPFSSKLREVDAILKSKPRILVMTKMDLCDKKETNKWINFYEKEGYIVVPLNLASDDSLKPLFTATNIVMENIDNKRMGKGLLKRRTRVLIVGIPNVGKSTLINRLVGKRVANVENKPGVTKDLSWIRINDELELMDTPGILWPKIDDGNIAYNLASLTAIKEEILPLYDVVEYILNTLYKYYPNILLERFGIENVSEDIINTLDIIGKRRGCLIKGGEIDYDKVVNIIINDVKSGIIKNITFDRFNENE